MLAASVVSGVMAPLLVPKDTPWGMLNGVVLAFAHGMFTVALALSMLAFLIVGYSTIQILGGFRLIYMGWKEASNHRAERKKSASKSSVRDPSSTKPQDPVPQQRRRATS